jgi:hypothetical protein
MFETLNFLPRDACKSDFREPSQFPVTLCQTLGCGIALDWLPNCK